MCARIAYLLLAALFVYLTVTIAAFVYLDWWQAVLVSAATFVLLVQAGRYGLKFLVRRAVGRVGEVAKGLFDAQSRVLRDATIDVHSVRPTEPPPGEPVGAFDTRWYVIEATIFPRRGQPGPSTEWQVTGLSLVPADAPAPKVFGEAPAGPEFTLHDLVLVEDGEPVVSVDGQVSGPRRLRFVTGIPGQVREVTFRYHFEQFGLIRLPQVMLGPALPH